MNRRLADMPAGQDRCWPRPWAMCMSSRSGAFCASRRSTFRGVNPGAKATIPNSPPKPPMSLGSISRRRRTPSSSVSTKSLRSKRWSGRLGYLRLPTGRALTGHSHDYKRNGTSTLFAAFEVATGKVTVAHKKRRRRVEFLDFMNDTVAINGDTALHVILDNLNTHKPKNDRWLKRNPNVHFHFTPTRASWLNQVEIWFSILEGKSLHGASFNSVAQLREHIDAFIEAYNENAKPFVWTKAKVHQRRVKGRRISEL